MGFDKVSGWEKYNLATEFLMSVPGVFADEAEREAFVVGIADVVQKEKDMAKRLDMANQISNIVETVAAGGIKKALTGLGFLSHLA